MALDFETQLHSVPIRNTKLEITPRREGSDALLVKVQLKYKGVVGLLARYVRARDYKRYELAGLSREMFERVDGKQSVEQLIDWLCEKERLTFLEGRALVLHYLRDLMRRGLIVIAADEERPCR